MPRFSITTSGIQTHYAARVEDAESITAYHEALRSRYGDEGDSLMYDVLRYASKDFTEQAKGKALLEYLDGRFGHLLPPTEAEVAATLEVAAAGLVDVRERLAGLTYGTPVDKEPIY